MNHLFALSENTEFIAKSMDNPFLPIFVPCKIVARAEIIDTEGRSSSRYVVQFPRRYRRMDASALMRTEFPEPISIYKITTHYVSSCDHAYAADEDLIKFDTRAERILLREKMNIHG